MGTKILYVAIATHRRLASAIRLRGHYLRGLSGNLLKRKDLK